MHGIVEEERKGVGSRVRAACEGSDPTHTAAGKPPYDTVETSDHRSSKSREKIPDFLRKIISKLALNCVLKKIIDVTHVHSTRYSIISKHRKEKILTGSTTD